MHKINGKSLPKLIFWLIPLIPTCIMIFIHISILIKITFMISFPIPITVMWMILIILISTSIYSLVSCPINVTIMAMISFSCPITISRSFNKSVFIVFSITYIFPISVPFLIPINIPPSITMKTLALKIWPCTSRSNIINSDNSPTNSLIENRKFMLKNIKYP